MSETVKAVVEIRVDGLLDVPKRDFDRAVESVEDEIRAHGYITEQRDEGDERTYTVEVEGPDLWECRDNLQEILDQVSNSGYVHRVTVERMPEREDIIAEIERNLLTRLGGQRQIAALMQETNCSQAQAKAALARVADTLKSKVKVAPIRTG